MKTGIAGSVVVAAIVAVAIAIAIAASRYAGGGGRHDASGKAGGDIVFVSAPGGTPRPDTAANTAAESGVPGSGADPAAMLPDPAAEAALDHAGMDDRANSRRRAMERQAEFTRDAISLDI